VWVRAPGFLGTETTLDRLVVPAGVVLRVGDELPVELQRKRYPPSMRILWDRAEPRDEPDAAGPDFSDADDDDLLPPPWVTDR
jgi:hypothetical protein